MIAQKQKSERWIYIYKIHFPTSNKCYIGQTIKLEIRMNEHLRADSLVGRALDKYDDFDISILHKTKSRKKANQLEIAEIAVHKSIAPGGYNLATGGEGGQSGLKRSKETGKKISEALTGKKRKPFSQEHKRKISVGNKGNQNAKGSQGVLGRHWTISEEGRANHKEVSNRPEVKEKVVASRMKMTILQYRKWKKEKDKRDAARTKNYSPEWVEKRGASRMKITVPQYKKQKAAKREAKRKKLQERIKKYQRQLQGLEGKKKQNVA